MTRQPTFWESQRLTLSDVLGQTADSLREYGRRYRHWVIAYSGGKDSSAVLTATVHLLGTGAVARPETLSILYADTRMELSPLQSAAMATLEECRRMGFDARVVLPEMDDRFMVYMLGRGVPPPSNTFRWCTSQLKIEPMMAALAALRQSCGEKLLVLTGVRLGESAARDGRISLSCSRDGGECGQGWYQESTPEAIADTLAPILHWRVCQVWDWLYVGLGNKATNPHPPKSPEWKTWYASRRLPSHGFDMRAVAEVYDMDDEGSANEISARTGCVGCNLASQDFSLQRILRRPEWAYLAPLRRLKPLYALLKEPGRRLKKQGGEMRQDGTPCSNQGRLGPLTMDSRLWGLGEILGIQGEINDAARLQGRPEYSLIDEEEEARIRDLIAAGTWPRRWSGDEPIGDSLPYEVRKDGSIQPFLFHPGD